MPTGWTIRVRDVNAGGRHVGSKAISEIDVDDFQERDLDRTFINRHGASVKFHIDFYWCSRGLSWGWLEQLDDRSTTRINPTPAENWRTLCVSQGCFLRYYQPEF